MIIEGLDGKNVKVISLVYGQRQVKGMYFWEKGEHIQKTPNDLRKDGKNAREIMRLYEELPEAEIQ